MKCLSNSLKKEKKEQKEKVTLGNLVLVREQIRGGLSCRVCVVLPSRCCHPEGAAGFVEAHGCQGWGTPTAYSPSNLCGLSACQPGSAAQDKPSHCLHFSLPFQALLFKPFFGFAVM